MQSTRLVAIVLVLLLATPVGAAQSQPAADNTVTRIDVGADGDAQWTVTVRTRLETQEDLQTYRTFQERVRANESRFLDPFRDRISGVVAAADNSSERQMRAGNVSLRTSIQEVPRRWGVLEYSFTWIGFARTDGSAVVVDGVFDGGLFIARNDTLVISGPGSDDVGYVTPEPTARTDGTLTWRGPRDFDDGDPSIRFVATANENASVTAANDRPTAGNDRSAAVGPLAMGVGTLLVAGVAGYVLYRRRTDTGRDNAGDEDAVEGGTAIVTDGDRVVALLEANDGRVKQTTVAEELDWSASKTSRVLSDLADEGRVEKLRLGRENVISLPERK